MFFGNVPVLAFLFWVFVIFGVVPIILYNLYLLIPYLLAVILIQLLYAITCKQNIITTILYFPANMFFMLRVMVKSLILRKNKNYTWKGRNIY